MAATPTSFASHEHFQAELDALADGEELELHAFEYPGPVVIKRAITIDGKGATLWSMAGPVCQIEGQGVTLKNLKIEITHEDLANGDKDSGCALIVHGGQNVLLENVEVRGSVRGLPAEEGQWRYPFSVKLDEIAHGHEHRFVLKLYVPVPCKITSGVHGVSVSPPMLTPGRNEVTLKVDSPARDALLLGTICLQTAFLKRQISISGHVVQSVQGGPRRDGEVLYEPLDWDQLGPVQTPRDPAIPVQPPTVPQPPPPPPKPPPQPAPSEAPKAEETGPTSGPEPAPTAQPVRGSSTSRLVHTTSQTNPLFNPPPPVDTEAAVFEPGVKLSSVFDPSVPLPQVEAPLPSETPITERAASNASLMASESGATGNGVENQASEGGGADVNRSQMPTPSPPQSKTARQPKGDRASGGSQSITLGGIFAVGPEPTKPAEKASTNGEGKKEDSQTEIAETRPKRKSQKGSPSVSDVFLK